jgi:zinc transporter ZupT
LKKQTLHPLAVGLLIGDAMHTMTDGVAIATAFLSCGSGTGWVVCAAICSHEVPHKLGDLFLMLSVGLPVLQATFLSFLSQCFALIGMTIVLLLGEFSHENAGLMLSFGIGTFLFISLSSIMPRLFAIHSLTQAFVVIFGFFLSVGLIGISTYILDADCS